MTNKIKFTALALLFQATSALAAVPGLINFQGRLLDSNKLPRTGSYSMIFRICDTLAGDCSSPVWTETQPAVVVANGVFAAQLGAVTPIAPDVFSAAARYLEITVAGETLSPRERLVAGSYSFRAGVADSLATNSASITLTGGITASSGTFTNTAGSGLAVSSSAYLATAGGKVGIGTVNPGEALEVNGNIKVGSATGGTVRGTTELVLRQDGDTYGPTALRLRNRSGENGAIFDASEATVALIDFIFKDSSEQRNIRYESRAGSARAGVPSFHIGGGSGGTANPDSPTLAVGDAYAAVASKLAVGSYNAPTQNFDVTGNSYFSGNVGIGLAPGARLHLPAGTAAAGTAPLKLTSGANLGTTEAGAIEFAGGHLYFTAADAGLRYQLDQQPGTPLTIAAIGAVPNANGMTLNAQQLNLQPADATYGGIVTTGAQIFAGAKTFNSTIVGSVNGNAGTTTKTDDLGTAVSVYPVWATSAASNIADKISTTKLSFIPNTGILSATGFAGPLTGNVSGNLTGTVLTAAQTNITSLGTLTGLGMSGAISGVTTLGLSGAITGAAAGNTINGMIINAGAVSGVTSLTASGAVAANVLSLTNGITASSATLGTAGQFKVATTGNVTMVDGTLLNLSAINNSGATEGLILPQANDVSAGTANGQIAWDSDNNLLQVGTGGGIKTMGIPNNITAYATSGSFTWTKPAGVSTVYVQVWGGGGAGGAAGSNLSRGGGGSGGYSAGLVTVTGNVTVTVGAAGTAPGGAGGLSRFAGATTLTANGGSGATTGTGAAGGTASGGTINLTGQLGGDGLSVDGGRSGAGGNAPFGGGGGRGQGGGNAAGGTGLNGDPGQQPGGGGAGGAESNGTGGAGGLGMVIVMY